MNSNAKIEAGLGAGYLKRNMKGEDEEVCQHL